MTVMSVDGVRAHCALGVSFRILMKVSGVAVIGYGAALAVLFHLLSQLVNHVLVLIPAVEVEGELSLGLVARVV